MRFSFLILIVLAAAVAGCKTVPSSDEPAGARTVVPKAIRIPPLEGRPPPRFREISYRVSGEGTIRRVDLILREQRPEYDVFEVVNHMPHGRSVRRWHGYAGLVHLLVTAGTPSPGATFATQSVVLAVDTWDGELFPLEPDNRLEVLMTTRDTLFNLQTGQIAEGENTCLYAFRVMERIEHPPPMYEAVEGPFYLIRQTIECIEGEPALREIVFVPSLGCPVEIRTLDLEGNVLSYRRLDHFVPADRSQASPLRRR